MALHCFISYQQIVRGGWHADCHTIIILEIGSITHPQEGEAHAQK